MRFYVGTLGISVDGESALVRIDIEATNRVALYTMLDSTGFSHEWHWSFDDYDLETFSDLAAVSVISYLDFVYDSTHGQARCAIAHAGMGLDGLPSLLTHVAQVHANVLPASQVLQ